MMNTATNAKLASRSFAPPMPPPRQGYPALHLVQPRKPQAAATIPANQLLATLPPAEHERLLPHLIPVELAAGQVLYESGCRPTNVYFPVDAIVSLHYDLEDGAAVEISVVGSEGLVGIALFMGGDSTPDRAVVQRAGRAYKLDAALLKSEFNRSGALSGALLRYTQALITQMAQNAVCNRRHSVEQQLCRRLLTSLDRQASSELLMTQESIANMLGVRREAVTEAAGRLQAAGMISYSRGRITILDRHKLEHASCECYSVVKSEFARLLPRPAVN